MKITDLSSIAAIFLAATLNCLAASNDGFTSLFNGKDLSGWTIGPDKSWVVENGEIAMKRAQFDAKEHNSDYLWAVEQYGDFIVELDFKTLEKANSGIYLRTSDPKNPVPTGIEIQVINSYGKPDLNIRSTCGAVYDCQTPTKNPVKAPGEWNHYRITCRKNKITVVLNGEQIIDMDLDRWAQAGKNPDGTKNKFPIALKDFARKGYFGFQDHGLPVWYRNIRIREISD